jgi:hypothetical protein
MANVKDSLTDAMAIDGALCVGIGDMNSGMTLGSAGTGVNIDVAIAGNTEVLRAKMKVMKSLGLNDHIEDILISLGAQYHLLRPIGNNLFIYLVLNRVTSNLAMARHKLALVSAALVV